MGYTGKNIIYLCKTHHFLFDHNTLTDEEMKLIEPHIMHMNPEVENILNSTVVPINKKAKYEQKNKKNYYEAWIEKNHRKFGFIRI